MGNPFMRTAPVMTNLRCRDGDIALVIKDSPICIANLGRLVRVRGPARVVIKTQMMGWRIKPLHRSRWSIEDHDDVFTRELVNWDSCIFHEDAWLLPIRPGLPAMDVEDTEGIAVPSNWRGCQPAPHALRRAIEEAAQ